MNSSTTVGACAVFTLVLITSLLPVNGQVNLLPSWTSNRRGGNPTINQERQTVYSGQSGNCATYVNFNNEPTCMGDEVLFFDLDRCELVCGAAEGVVNSRRVRRRNLFFP